MPSDVKLDQGDGSWVTVEASVLNAQAADLILDHPARRKQAGGARRALVHDAGDGLTINFNGDYPGGVTIHGLKNQLRLSPEVQSGSTPKLPKRGQHGDLRMIRNLTRIGNEVVGDVLTLWVCVPGIAIGGVVWQQVMLGDTVVGTEE